MMRRALVRLMVMLIAMSLSAVVLAPLACGKYARPQRISQQPADVSGATVERDRDDQNEEADKPRKPWDRSR